MDKHTKSLVIFTGWGQTAVESYNGSGYWKARMDRVNNAEYVFLVRNHRATWATKNDGVDHGQAFLVGKINKCVNAYDIDETFDDDRIFIEFKKYALLPENKNVKNAWEELTKTKRSARGQRNPVAYRDTDWILDKLNISLDELNWISLEENDGDDFDFEDDFDFKVNFEDDDDDDFDDDFDEGFHTPRRNRRLGAAISQAKRIVADAAGVSPDDVTIDITF